MKDFFLSLLVLFFLAFTCHAQQCVPNSLTTDELMEMEDDVESYRFSAKTYDNLADFTITTVGPEPNLIIDQGIRFGRSNGSVDSCQIILTFSKPILSADFILSHFNNNLIGTEEIQEFNVYQKNGTNITQSSKFIWLTGEECGIPGAIIRSTTFNQATRTISADYMTDESQGNGRIFISSKTPFTKITFRHQDMPAERHTAHGVVLEDLHFCVVMPAPFATRDSATTLFNKQIHIKVSANDKDSTFAVDANSVDLDPYAPGQQFFKKERGGTFILDTLGRVVTFTPDQGFSGLCIGHYTIDNSYGLHSNIAPIIVQVEKNSATEILAQEKPIKEVYSDIYFDFDKTDIKAESAKELDKYIVLYKKYPHLILEVRSYSDCRGNTSYNAILSQKRADASAKYLIAKGIPASQLVQKGLGEVDVKTCDCNSKESSCPEKEYQNSRRTEVIVVTLGE